MDFHFLLQGIFLTQGLNPGLPHCRQILYCLSHLEAHPVPQKILVFIELYASKQRNKLNNLPKVIQLARNYHEDSEIFWLCFSTETMFSKWSSEGWNRSHHYVEYLFKSWLFLGHHHLPWQMLRVWISLLLETSIIPHVTTQSQSLLIKVSIINRKNLGICLENGLTVAKLLDNTEHIPRLFFSSSILYSWDLSSSVFWTMNNFHSFKIFWLFLITWAVQENLASEYWPSLWSICFQGYSI